MDSIKSFFKLIGLVLLIVVAGAIVFFFAFWFFVAFLAMLGLFLAVWAVGIPLTIKENGVKTGHLRWFTFYPVKQPWQP